MRIIYGSLEKDKLIISREDEFISEEDKKKGNLRKMKRLKMDKRFVGYCRLAKIK